MENTNNEQTIVQQTSQVEPDKKKTDLEKRISFSWGRVIKQGIKNMKDDIDPVYKGAKMGFYGLHAIPTWVREFKDGRLENDSHGWASLTGIFVAGTTGLAYYIGTTEAVKNYGVEGYGVLGIPLVFQGMSYIKEAFRRAKGKEYGRVIKARLQQKINSETTEQYDLSYKNMVEQYATNINSNRATRGNNTETVAPDSDGLKMQVYKELSMLTENIFKELFAHNHVGSKYELSPDLEVSTKRDRYKYRRSGGSFDANSDLNNVFAKMVWDTVSKNNGSANIEWLGKVTAIYGQDDPDSVHYEVVPTKMWKK